jgi:DNA-directed RNA polymerase specialized sigma24 family protein
MTDTEPPRALSSLEDDLDQAMLEVLGKDNPHAYSTLSFIQRSLWQFHLATLFEAHEILNEAYIRGKEFLRSGGMIHRPHAWLKSTSFNIIREHSRKQKKEQSLDPELVELIPCLKGLEESTITQEDISYRWKSLLTSLQLLSAKNPEGAQLLRLKAKGLSWKEIQQQLVQQQGDAPSESTLRQKASRAKKALRQIYHSQTADSADLSIP